MTCLFQVIKGYADCSMIQPQHVHTRKIKQVYFKSMCGHIIFLGMVNCCKRE